MPSTSTAAASSSSSPIPLAHHIPSLLFVAVTVLTSTLISRTQPTPYIDEIFHIPQAQKYCSALTSHPESGASSIFDLWQRLRNVEYDGKLTTPPGLYAISVGLAKVLPGWECQDVVWLRGTNLVLLLTLPVLIARILKQIDQERTPNSASTHPSSTANLVKSEPARKRTVSRRDIERLQRQTKLESPPTPDGSHDSLPDTVPLTLSGSGSTSTAPATAALLPAASKREEATPYTMAVACTIAFLPPLWFFGFFYYTDLASIWLVLACLTLYYDLNRRSDSSSSSSYTTMALVAFISILAVLVRQTNIVWILFCAAQSILAHLPAPSSSPAHQGTLFQEVQGVFHAAFGKKERKGFWKVVLRNTAPLMPMLVGCAWFVRWNGSIVLGDKSNHQAGLHLPQLGYFLAFASAFGIFPLIFALSTSTATQSTKRKEETTLLGTLKTTIRGATGTLFGTILGGASSIAGFLVVLIAFYYAVDRYTIDHPFLLADNRHYTFYIWRLFRRKYILSVFGFGSGSEAGKTMAVVMEPRFVVVPLYAVALFAWCRAAIQQQQRSSSSSSTRTGQGLLSLWTLLFWCSTAATLVPTPLVEPRYYLIPYLLLRIYTQPCSTYAEEEVEGKVAELKDGKSKRERERVEGRWTFLMLELILYAVVNGITVGLFVTKSFEWPPNAVDQQRFEGTTMRFIW